MQRTQGFEQCPWSGMEASSDVVAHGPIELLAGELE